MIRFGELGNLCCFDFRALRGSVEGFALYGVAARPSSPSLFHCCTLWVYDWKEHHIVEIS